LAEALGGPRAIKRARLRFPWGHAPPWLVPPLPRALTLDSDPLAPPWPDVLITCGQSSARLSVALKRSSGGRIFTIHIQDPRLDPRRFDLVAAPRHDPARGENVIVTEAAIHAVTRAKLEAARAAFAPGIEHLPRPLVAVLIGGPTRRSSLDPRRMAAICDDLLALAARYKAGLVVTPSRRTGPACEAVMRERLSGPGRLVWDGLGDNPYLGFLALADAIIATGDSVSMISEASATGKPVYVIELGDEPRRIRRFHESLRAAGITRRFGGTIESWSYAPLEDTARVAAEVRRRMARRSPAG